MLVMLLILCPSVISAKVSKISQKDLFLTTGACVQYDGVLVEANQYVEYARELKACDRMLERSLELTVKASQLERELEKERSIRPQGFNSSSFMYGLLFGVVSFFALQGQR